MNDSNAEQALMADKNIPLHSADHQEADLKTDEEGEWDLKTKDDVIDDDWDVWTYWTSIQQMLSNQQGWTEGTRKLQQYHRVSILL